MKTKTEMFKDEFSSFEIQIDHCTFNDDYHNNSAFVIFISEISCSQLETNWNYINSWVAANIQIDLETDFEIWNLYLVFIVNEIVQKELKSKIENDTFSSRKIVVDDCMSKEEVIKHYITKEDLTSKFKLSKLGISSTLSKEIKPVLQNSKNDDLDMSASEIFKPDPLLQKLIEKYDLAGRKDNKTREALNSLIQKQSK